MKTDYKNSSNKSGVYKIVNLLNGKVYIGSAKVFKVRFNQHLKSLEKNKHQNKHLQAAFNNDGTDNFLFEVLEVLEDSIKEYRFQIEQEYINEYLNDWESCYNFKRETIQKERSCSSKTPEETAKKHSESSKELWQDPEYRQNILNKLDERSKDPEFLKKLSEAQKRIGNKPPTQFGNKYRVGHKMSEVNKQKLIAINTGRKMSDFNKQQLLKANKGRVVSEETRQKRRLAREKQGPTFFKTYKLIDPVGNVIEIVNLRKWSRENKLCYKVLNRLVNKKINSYKGYKTI
jgi:group I intron endonuclease